MHNSPFELDTPTFNFFMEYVVKNYRNELALSYVNEAAFSYGQMVIAAYKFATLLDKAKVPQRSHIALLSQSSPWWCIAYIAIIASNRVVVPILPDFPESDIAHIIAHSDSTYGVVSNKLYPKYKKCNVKLPLFCLDGLYKVRSSKAELDVVEIEDYLNELKKEDEDNLLGEALAYFKNCKIDGDAMCSIVYTSGTSGMSKGVMLSQHNICIDANSANVCPPPINRCNSLSILPLSHVYECTIGFFTTATRGIHIHFLRRNLSPAVLMPALKSVAPSIMMSVPLLLEKIYRKQVLPKFTKNGFMRFIYKIPLFRKILHRIAGISLYKSFGGKMKFFGIGGAGLDPQVEQFLREAKFPYAMGYGLTETSPLVAGFNFWKSRYRSTGHLIPDVEVKIDNPDPKTGEGEILVKGPTVMLGYYKDKKRTSSVMTKDGYFRTGDLGYLKDNYLYISGRCKNMLLGSNGENIYPEVIESMLNEFDLIEESIVLQDKNKNLVAKIELNNDYLSKEYPQMKGSDGNIILSKLPDELKHQLVIIKEKLNKRLSKFSQVKFLIHQKSPFKKTPTNKIKRFLHEDINDTDEKL